MHLGFFRGQEEIELLFEELIKGALVAEIRLDELALPAFAEAPAHFVFPGNGLGFQGRRLPRQLPPGQLLGSGLRHGPVECTGLTIIVTVTELVLYDPGIRPYAGFFAFHNFLCHGLGSQPDNPWWI